MERLTRRKGHHHRRRRAGTGRPRRLRRTRGASWAVHGSCAIQAARPGAARASIQQRHLPNVRLITHEGKRVRFYDDLVKNKKVVLTFVSSGAPASAKVTENLAKIQRFFGPRMGQDIFLYSIARTPEIDTSSVLARWAAEHDAGPGWRFLTGKTADVERLRHALGFASPDPVEDADPAYSVGVAPPRSENLRCAGHIASRKPARGSLRTRCCWTSARPSTRTRACPGKSIRQPLRARRPSGTAGRGWPASTTDHLRQHVARLGA